MNAPSFAIGIPTINRSDLLNESLSKYFKDFPNVEIYIIDNGGQKIKSRSNNFHYFNPEENFGVAKSWNYLCDKIFKEHDFALILNDDVYLGLSEDEVHEVINEQSFDLLKCEEEFHLCSFILSSSCFATHRFDEDFFPAYFEDRDYFYRLKLDNKEKVENKKLNPEIFLNSQTISPDGGDPSINKNFKLLAKLYMEKWGGLPNRETFTTPYNEGSEDYMNFKISYCINHNGSNLHLESLLIYLRDRKRFHDEVIVQFPESKNSKKLKSILKKFNSKSVVFSDLNETKIKNNLKLKCAGDYIFFLNSLETPSNETVTNLHQILSSNVDIDLFLVPRINLHPNDSLPPENSNEYGWSNWPDYQERIFKNKFNLKFKDDKIEGLTSGAKLPDSPEYAITQVFE